jgi:hypothetical protein
MSSDTPELQAERLRVHQAKEVERLRALIPTLCGDMGHCLRFGGPEQGELDNLAAKYGVKRKGHDLPDDWRCSTPERQAHWKRQREPDESLRVRLIEAIEACDALTLDEQAFIARRDRTK